MRVVLHLHYPELWPEFEAALKRMPGKWGLLVTLTPEARAAEGAIHRAFPGAATYPVENRGRDIGPFFELLHAGALDGAEAVCKLHGKRSLSDGRPEIGGELWRRSAVGALVRNAERVVNLFRARSDVGLVGSAHLLVPNGRFPEAAAWGGVRHRVQELLERLDIARPSLEFFAGSMFWASRQAVSELRRLRLRQSDFEDEAAFTAESLAHAGERIFIPVARHAGLAVGLLPANGEDIAIVATPPRRGDRRQRP